MPYLFVDYDQGIGGEYICANLSKSDQCVTLEYIKYSSGRTKVFDLFNNEFLKISPTISPIESDSKLYDVIPSHRSCSLAEKIIGPIRSLRIISPIGNEKLWKYCKYQQMQKVMLKPVPKELFLGEIQMLQRTATNPNFLKQVNKDMLAIELYMLSKNIELAEENKNKFIEYLVDKDKRDEPKYNYDLNIPYENFIHNPRQVEQQIYKTFGIEIIDTWLDTFGRNYEDWLSKT